MSSVVDIQVVVAVHVKPGELIMMTVILSCDDYHDDCNVDALMTMVTFKRNFSRMDSV